MGEKGDALKIVQKDKCNVASPTQHHLEHQYVLHYSE